MKGRRLIGLVAAGMLGLGPAAAVPPAAAAPAVSPGPTATGTAGVVDRVVRDPLIDENSGMVAGRRSPGVLWAIEDSGNPPVVDGIDPAGRTVARLTLIGATNVDWEAIAPVRLPGGYPGLAIADIGDNLAGRRNVVIYVIAEPSRPATARVPVLATLRLTYPDGSGDAETLLSDPRDGHLYIVSKDLLGAALYAVPPSLWPPASFPKGLRRAAVLRLRAGLAAPLITDGAVLPDGRVVLRGYQDAYLFPPAEGMTGVRVEPLARRRLPDEQQGEALALPDGGKPALIGSEGVRQPILRVGLDGLVPAAPGAHSPAGHSPPGHSLSRAGATSSPEGARRGSRSTTRWRSYLMPGLLGVLSAALAFIVLLLRDRRRQRLRPPRRSPRR